MFDPTAKIAAILARYTRDPIAATTQLSRLGIDHLDLAMVAVDIEDAFDISLGFGDDGSGIVTVGDLAVCVTRRLEAKAARPAPSSLPPKRPWMCTGAKRQSAGA